MKAKSHLTVAAVISALIGVLIGNFIKNMPEYFGLSDLIGTIFIVFGIFILISSIPELIIAIARMGTILGTLSLISAFLSVAAGFILIFYHSKIIIPIIAAYLVIFPLVRIIFAPSRQHRRSALTALAPKIVLGILLIVFFPAASGLADKVFTLILTCIGWGTIAFSLLALLIFLFVLHVLPHIVKKKCSRDDSTIYLDDEDFNDKNN